MIPLSGPLPQVLAPASGLRPDEVGVFGIAQCYDKKLEATRKVSEWMVEQLQ